MALPSKTQIFAARIVDCTCHRQTVPRFTRTPSFPVQSCAGLYLSINPDVLYLLAYQDHATSLNFYRVDIGRA